MARYNIKNMLALMYILIPVMFYGLAYIGSYSSGGLKLEFYGGHYVTSNSFLLLTVGHFILGLMILKGLLNNDFVIVILERKIIHFDILLVLVFILSLTFPFGLIRMLLFPIFVMMYVRRKHYFITNVILYSFAIFLLLGYSIRFPLVQLTLLCFIPFFSVQSKTRLVIFSVVALMVMVFILQPIRAGMVPFLEPVGAVAIFTHLQPIYIGADLSLELSSDLMLLFSETIPFLKSITGTESVITIIAKDGLSDAAFQSGTRYGSNSAMYFSFFGLIVIIFMIALFRAFFFVRSDKLLQSFILSYFLIYGAYFIRRSIGTYFIDLFVFIFMYFLFSFLIEIFGKNRVMYRK